MIIDIETNLIDTSRITAISMIELTASRAGEPGTPASQMLVMGFAAFNIHLNGTVVTIQRTLQLNCHQDKFAETILPLRLDIEHLRNQVASNWEQANVGVIKISPIDLTPLPTDPTPFVEEKTIRRVKTRDSKQSATKKGKRK